MTNLLNVNVVYRQVRNPNFHLVPIKDKGYRVTSALFKDSRGLSLDDGALCTPEETAARFPGCGVISIPKSSFIEIGFPVESDPLDDNPAHCIVRERIHPESLIRSLIKASKAVIHPPSYKLLDGDGII